jgi:hypothetical protein
MTVGNPIERAAPFQNDQIGKSFLVVHQNARKCFVCEGTLTRQTAPRHPQVVYFPSKEIEL